jgi:hypothetical protein
MVDMDLTGVSGKYEVTLNPAIPTTGWMEETQNSSANLDFVPAVQSFFYVFILLTIHKKSGDVVLHNDDPIFMNTLGLLRIPPPGGLTYGGGDPVILKTADGVPWPDPNNPCKLAHVSHMPVRKDPSPQWFRGAASRSGLQVAVQDADSGLATVTTLSTTTNASVSIPPIPANPTDPLVVTATRLNLAKPMVVAVHAVDVTGKTNDFRASMSPVRSGGNTIMRARGPSVMILNGDVGLQDVTLTVNGVTFQVSDLQSSETREVDISSALIKGGKNRITLTGEGPEGATADALVAG